MKKIWNHWLKEAVAIYSVLYTVTTIINSILYLSANIYEDPSGNWHELDRAIIMFIGICAYELATKLPIKNLFIKAITVYIPTMALAFIYVWSTSFREPLAKSAYTDIAINYTGLYLIVFIVIVVRDIVKKRKGN